MVAPKKNNNIQTNQNLNNANTHVAINKNNEKVLSDNIETIEMKTLENNKNDHSINIVDSIVKEAEKLAKQTNDVQKILNNVKASIQKNFLDYRQAWPVVKALNDTNNKNLKAVATRLSLFIGNILENTNKRKNKKMYITKENLRKLVRKVVKQKLHEVNLNTKQNYLDQEKKRLEIEKMRQEINMLTLEFLEKLTNKLDIDLDYLNLNPEVSETYRSIHKKLESSVRSAASQLFHISAILKAATKK